MRPAGQRRIWEAARGDAEGGSRARREWTGKGSLRDGQTWSGAYGHGRRPCKSESRELGLVMAEWVCNDAHDGGPEVVVEVCERDASVLHNGQNDEGGFQG